MYSTYIYKHNPILFSENLMDVQRNIVDTRCLTVTLRYTFNNAKDKYKGTGAGNDEKGRL